MKDYERYRINGTEKRHCTLCGTMFDKEKDISRCVCKNCIGEWSKFGEKKEHRFCVGCGKEVFNTNGVRRDKNCLQCRIHAAAVNRSCTNLMKSFPDKISIIYECEHKENNKEYHHPDYNYPFFVVKLCHSCHRRVTPAGTKNGTKCNPYLKLNAAVRRAK